MENENLDLSVEDGKRIAVILDIAEYDQIVEYVEEIEDLVALQEVREEPLQFRSLDEFLSEHNPGV
uniref:Antitoxin Phd_YefM, type II toxin-antitoxin system n=1 Tax=Candidatus Kentrum sp. LPFa TaxID=2126335 RepID=A0A450Y1V0_9GAMM|nr:MAG: hypothetical protein BECKLPF1236A_GA0070988_103793 [Candidatus Kentron sp. LPFa]VFK35516.1 MAG: hypothetical protein BECKLPF1236C_GA0070990_103843 [Candidatus Kentron sp. LPFa]